MKTTAQVIRDSGIPGRLVRAVIRQLGGKDPLEDICQHGIDSGFHGFIYYSDTIAFFKRNRREISELVRQQAEDFGASPVDFVASFRCLDPKDKDPEKMDEIGRCLYGGRIGPNYTQVPNALAWYASEEVARAFCDD